ncbi:MAG: hypothetical protein J7521_21075 [Caulobacter sp.]|nr:hypothetical protein [Caulobacter sp.]
MTASSLSQAVIKRAIAAMDAQGHPVKAARLCANGDVILLTESPAGLQPLDLNDGGSWVDLAGETEVRRA